MRSLLRLISAMTKVERIVLGVLLSMLLISFFMITRLFYRQNTIDVAVSGGTYIEGSVGDIQPLNPWFVTGNDVSRDIISLIFSGLMKYDPASGTIVDDLATVKISSDYRIYTATLKQGLFWHDSTPEHPHPVTADDVVFTFKTLQNTDFPNPILQQNFQGVEIDKIDAQTVRFRLNKPYTFFTSNLTLGLVPMNAFDGVPVQKLDQALDFGFRPVGAGPYSFVSLLQTDLSSEVTVKRFERPATMPDYKIDRIVFRVFSEYSALLTDITNVNGIRLVPRNEKGQPILPRHFRSLPYTLPQYVGLFFNLDRAIPADRGVRLGLELATNKQEVADAIHEPHIVDTPLLEVNTGDWQYRFDAAAAKGAFFESSWNMPEKIRLQRLLERHEANALGPLSGIQPIALLGSGATVTVTGSLQGVSLPAFINGIRVQTGSTQGGSVQALSGSWMARLPAGNGFSGSLRTGTNVIRLTDAKDNVIDTAFLERITDTKEFERASIEHALVDQFLLSKKLPENDPRVLTVQNFTMENGRLRRKTKNDAPNTRIDVKGKPLSITLLTSPTPANYAKVASIISAQWKSVGVDVHLDIPESKKEFEEKLLSRNYDVLLFGQALFDNLDSYPYWHSSQIQEKTTDIKKMKLDAFNLSQYASFEADSELARIRETASAATRTSTLKQLNDQLKQDIPAIVLYSPLYIYANDESLHGITQGKYALHADRFADEHHWYITTKRRFVAGRSWLSFPRWFFSLVRDR